MRCIVFEVKGEYAQFKKPYSPMSPVTYPFPPPTAVMGLLGAIIGYEKHEYHERLGWQSLRIAVSLRQPVQVFRTSINLLNTKNGTDTFFRPKVDKDTHIQVPFEFLKFPHYRIYVSGLLEKAMNELAKNLQMGCTAFTPVLGLASCLADVEWIGEWEAHPFDTLEWVTSTVVPISGDVKIHYDDNRRYHRLRVPAIMDSQRVVHNYQEVIVAENAQTIRGQGGDNLFFKVNNETIALFPNFRPS
ncbi:type I-B CRISPR-associated protein Cas5b [Candidatus Parabeggiatoa sp. HSG14]|uniref:type I-B CRISPR-associated protein Cas5b n=1 Tax=Candidatus Parabeggiatoa sp. HSG14 TaxID=3055593 RepID=UPI0025A8CFCE|nr:type I-B CRISPR-associated protein Cas5b [Thiotrichales bacterium HSG14]